MYLMMLPNTLRPSTTPCFEHQQAVLQQDDVGGFLGDVHRAVDRDAHVGGLEGRGVVDAVAHEAHHVPVLLQGADDALLVGRRELGKDGGLLGGLAPGAASSISSMAGPSSTWSTGRPTWRQMVVVTRSLSPVRILTATLYCLSGPSASRGGVLGRVEEGQEAHQGHALLRRPRCKRLAPVRRQPLVGQARSRGSPRRSGGPPAPCGLASYSGRRGEHLALDFHLGADVEDLFHRALGDQQALALVVLHHHRHAPAAEIEGDLVDLVVAVVDRCARRSRCTCSSTATSIRFFRPVW